MRNIVLERENGKLVEIRKGDASMNRKEIMNHHFDIGSLIVIAITFILFNIALFTQGITHDILLESGVFLVSVKLIIMAYRNNRTSKEISKELSDIKSILENKLK